MVKFKALQSAIVTDSNVSNVTKDVTKNATIEHAIVELLRENQGITTTEMAECLSVTRRTIQRGLDSLKGQGIIERKGGRRYGYWDVKV